MRTRAFIDSRNILSSLILVRLRAAFQIYLFVCVMIVSPRFCSSWYQSLSRSGVSWIESGMNKIILSVSQGWFDRTLTQIAGFSLPCLQWYALQHNHSKRFPLPEYAKWHHFGCVFIVFSFDAAHSIFNTEKLLIPQQFSLHCCHRVYNNVLV
jgi:hypothetical protein